MYTDPMGTTEWWEWLLAGVAVVAAVVTLAIVAGAVGGLAGVALTTMAISTGVNAIIGGVSAVMGGTSIAGGILSGAIKGFGIGVAVGLGIMTGGGAFSVLGGFVAFGGALATNFVAGSLSHIVDNAFNGKEITVKDVLGNGAMQMLSSVFAFVAGAAIGASGAYNIPGVNKMFSAKWIFLICQFSLFLILCGYNVLFPDGFVAIIYTLSNFPVRKIASAPLSLLSVKSSSILFTGYNKATDTKFFCILPYFYVFCKRLKYNFRNL